jgi:hypothetical protein
MRAVVLTAGVVFALVSVATTAGAQIRGRLTSRPQIPSAAPRSPDAPRSPVAPRPPFPIWWNWGVVVLPEAVTLEQPPLGPNAPTGGVQLDIQPWSAEVYVDGTSVGHVEQFRGYYQHLTLPAGPHVIAVVAPGRDPLIFAVTVVPGRVVTQRGALSVSGTTLP